MQAHQISIVEYVGKPFDDADYDLLLEQFANERPADLEVWRKTERELFESRRGLCAYPDQPLMKLCLDFLRPRMVDELGGMGPSHAWNALRGRILRSLIDEDPKLNPAPDRLLVTEPRTINDKSLLRSLKHFEMSNRKSGANGSTSKPKGALKTIRFVSFQTHSATSCKRTAGFKQALRCRVPLWR
jgi:hypothetical protein